VRFADLEREIRDVIPPDEIDMLIDNIGIPNSWPAIAQGDIPTISSADGEILISLNKEKHAPTRDYEVLLRKRLHDKFPDMTFFFQPANITSQILNFGLPAPIDLQVVGRNAEGELQDRPETGEKHRAHSRRGDVHVHQVVDQPEIRLNVDRVKAAQLGLTQRDVTSSMLISLSGNGTVAPNFWVNWTNGVNYNVGVQTPQYRIDSLDALLAHSHLAGRERRQWQHHARSAGWRAPAGPASVGASPSGSSQAYGNPGAMAGSTQLLSNLVPCTGSYARHRQPLQRLAGLRCVRQRGPARSGRRGRGSDENHARREKPHLPRGTSFSLRGQVATPCNRRSSAWAGMIFAVVLVYLLMTVNFQSWLDPFIILTALPGAMAGILWMLFLTGTTLSVPSLMGAIMCIGVATANSILMVTFANDERETVPSRAKPCSPPAMRASGPC
jgi:multidrug efflux pump subunit AcrB